MRPRPIARHLVYAIGSESMELSAITLRRGLVVRQAPFWQFELRTCIDGELMPRVATMTETQQGQRESGVIGNR